MFDFHFCCFQGCFLNGNLYALDEEGHALWNIDLDRRCVELEVLLSNSKNERAPYSTVHALEKKLILTPGMANRIAIYNCKTKMLEQTIVYRNSYQLIDELRLPYKFAGAFVHENIAYLVGGSAPEILKVGFYDNELRSDLVWCKNRICGIRNSDYLYWFSDGVKCDGRRIYITGGKLCAVFSVNVDTSECEVYEVPIDVINVYGIIPNQEKKLILGTTSTSSVLVEWENGNKWGKRFIVENSKRTICWWDPIEVNGCFYLFQMNGNNVYKYNPDSGEISLLENVAKAIGRIPETYMSLTYLIRLIGVLDSKIVFTSGWNRKWYIYDTISAEVESFLLAYPTDYIKEVYWSDHYKKKSYEFETLNEAELSLDWYIKLV